MFVTNGFLKCSMVASLVGVLGIAVTGGTLLGARRGRHAGWNRMVNIEMAMARCAG